METKYMIGGALCILACLTIVGIAGYIGGNSDCKRNFDCRSFCLNTLVAFKDDQLMDNYLKVEKHKVHSLCLILISFGVALGLFFHGFPFRFDFRRSTVYNEYSEDDDDEADEDALGG